MNWFTKWRNRFAEWRLRVRAKLAAVSPKQKRKIAVSVIVIAIAVLSFLSVWAGGTNAYDVQGLLVGVLRLNALMIWVLFFQRLKSAVDDDDLEEDWKRIDNGNLATAMYRAAEFAVMVIAGAMLLSKI